MGIITLNESVTIDEVTEIFIRINSQGTKLNQADFAMSRMAANEKYGGNKLLKCYLEDEESSIDIKSIIMMKDDTDKELIEVYHNAKNTQSKIENYITSNSAKVDIDVIGKIKKGMSNSNCVQKSRGIVLTNDSKIKVMPVLLIDEFDVSANHGCAIGKIDDEGLYYLMSRGISKKDAEMLIIKGFLSPILSSLSSEELKEEILKLQDQKL